MRKYVEMKFGFQKQKQKHLFNARLLKTRSSHWCLQMPNLLDLLKF